MKVTPTEAACLDSIEEIFEEEQRKLRNMVALLTINGCAALVALVTFATVL